jgi:hypothetical protein
MPIEVYEFQDRLRALLGVQSVGVEFTDEELARMADRYRLCAGKERWDVRQYVGRTGVGAREYRVMRGTGVQDVYRSAERVHADAVGAALNALESQGKS